MLWTALCQHLCRIRRHFQKHAVSVISGIKDFVPELVQGGYEPFSNLVKKASRWINEEKAVDVTNFKSVHISQENGKVSRNAFNSFWEHNWESPLHYKAPVVTYLPSLTRIHGLTKISQLRQAWIWENRRRRQYCLRLKTRSVVKLGEGTKGRHHETEEPCPKEGCCRHNVLRANKDLMSVHGRCLYFGWKEDLHAAMDVP